MSMNRCPKCEGKNIDVGRITSAGAVCYRSDRQRTPFVKVNCLSYVCLDCGYLESFVEQPYLEKIKQMQPLKKV